MKITKLINPFCLLPIGIILLIWIYDWGWSDLFPKITDSTYFFLSLLIIVLFLMYFFLNKYKRVKYETIPVNALSKFKIKRVLFFVAFLFIIDVAYSGNIPLLIGNIDVYQNFGMPVVDPLILALTCFYSIFWFHCFLSTKQKKYLFCILCMIVICLLMNRRANLIYIFVGMLFMYLQKIERIKIYILAIVIAVIISMAFFFGKLGETKTGLPASYAVDNMGGSQAFTKSGVADEFYITYLYSESPLANFQLTVQKQVPNEESFVGLVLSQYVPDFISNRLKPMLGYDNYPQKGIEQVMSVLNVGTYYVGGYICYGWIGVAISCLYLILVALITYKCYPPKSIYHTTINAFLCAIFIMSLFSNVIRIGSILFVLFIPYFINKIHQLQYKKN